jgi:hypothetical protein
MAALEFAVRQVAVLDPALPVFLQDPYQHCSLTYIRWMPDKIRSINIQSDNISAQKSDDSLWRALIEMTLANLARKIM